VHSLLHADGPPFMSLSLTIMAHRAARTWRGDGSRPASPQRPRCSRDGLGVPDYLLGHAVQKIHLRGVPGCAFWSRVPYSRLSHCLGDVGGHALRA
jgi:hypothetical protein